ncbi:MAG: cytochrome c oxidase subunit 3 [Planctomycetaceae bacterium]|nr:cytochrome c oxidase subunit 3 [Planctomycetaceae bacterium]
MAAAYSEKDPINPTQNIESWKLLIKLLVGSLTIFFMAGIMGFVVIQQQHINLRYSRSLDVPASLWISTVALLVVSYSLHRSISYAKREQLETLKKVTLVGIAGALLFTLFQIIGMHDVYQEHLHLKSSSIWNMSGISFVMILSHGLHVAAGLIWLAIVARNVFAKRYDHEYHLGLTLCAYYWHFLDFVWVVMFVVFLGSSIS